MTRHDPIIAADEAEEQSATFALRTAQSPEEVLAVWETDCSHFRGEARQRLLEERTIAYRRLGAYAA